MSTKQEKKRLGRGLSALLGEVDLADPKSKDNAPELSSTRSMAVDLIDPNAHQPRRNFNDAELQELAESIREKGIIQPLIVRPNPHKENHYEIVAGERRWRAAQIAKLHELPVIVRDLDDQDVLELSIIENIQRVDLNPIEEASAYNQLIEKFDYTQEQLARIMGKSRSYIANIMRLLQLPEKVCAMLRDNSLTVGHARALVVANDPIPLAEKVKNLGLSVRQTEQLVKEQNSKTVEKKEKTKHEKDPDTLILEQDLSSLIKMKVTISHQNNKGAGNISIYYNNLEELDWFCENINKIKK